MSFMAIAIISIMGAGLLGFLGILVQYLLKQNAQRHDEHVDAMGAIHEQGLRTVELHTATLELIQQSALTARKHADELHREAMNAIAALDREHREHREKLHTETMAQIAALSERTAVLETRADREKPGPR